MADEIDSIVKGSPLPGREIKASSLTSPTPIVITYGPSGDVQSGHEGSHDEEKSDLNDTSGGNPNKVIDPLRHTPSSPSMIYLNLLILEASLRAQYLELRARRRHHTFFLVVLSIWILGFGYALFLAPREDGRGVGGSVYWGVELLEKLCFLGGMITALLVWGTGIFERGVRWPRKWLSVSNRGLRGFNCKLVLIRRSWLAELASTMGFFLSYGLFSRNASSSYRFVDTPILQEIDQELRESLNPEKGLPDGTGRSPFSSSVAAAAAAAVMGGSRSAHGIRTFDREGTDDSGDGHEEDLAPGGDYVKLLLLPKPFSAEFRENWEIYRAEYWDRENRRRALLRQKLQERDTSYARQRWGLFWWLPWHQTTIQRYFSQEQMAQRNALSFAYHSHVGQHHRSANQSQGQGGRLRSGSRLRRSQTPSLDPLSSSDSYHQATPSTSTSPPSFHNHSNGTITTVASSPSASRKTSNASTISTSGRSTPERRRKKTGKSKSTSSVASSNTSYRRTPSPPIPE